MFPQHSTAQLDSTCLEQVFFGFPLWIVSGTFFWYHLGQGSRRAEPILKGDIKTLQTTDKLTQKQITLVSAIVVLCAIVHTCYVTLLCCFVLCCSGLFEALL